MIRSILAGLLLAASLAASPSPALAAPPECHDDWLWSYSLDLPQGFWSEDGHFYFIRGKVDGAVVFTPPFIGFIVTPNAPLYQGQARLRFFAILALSDGAIVGTRFLNPAQDTVFQVSDDLVGTKAEADAFAARETIEVSWDGGAWVELRRSPVISLCSFDPLKVGLWERQWGPAYRR
jgi:hypothetical protein